MQGLGWEVGGCSADLAARSVPHAVLSTNSCGTAASSGASASDATYKRLLGSAAAPSDARSSKPRPPAASGTRRSPPSCTTISTSAARQM